MKDSKVTKSQLSNIFVLAAEHKMDSDLLHAYVEALIGKDSLKKLSIEEAGRVIDSLSGKDVVSRFPRQEVLSERQKKLIISLAIQLGWVREDNKNLADFDRLNGFVRKQYDTLYMMALSRSNASKCIEAMKEMVDRIKES